MNPRKDSKYAPKASTVVSISSASATAAVSSAISEVELKTLKLEVAELRTMITAIMQTQGSPGTVVISN